MANEKNMAEDKDLIKHGDEIVKSRGSKKSPVIGDNGLQVEPGDNSHYLRMAPVKTDE